MKPLIGIGGSFSYKNENPSLAFSHGREWQITPDDYIKSVELAGGSPVILPVTQNVESLSTILSKLDGIVFTGGSDIDPQYYGEALHHKLGSIDPKRDKHEIDLSKYVLEKMDIPVLGICRGVQLINVASGGSLYQDLKTQIAGSNRHDLVNSPKHHPVQPIHIKKDSKLFEILSNDQIQVNSYHHQAVKDLGKGFEITATAPDGVVEAIEMNGSRFVLGVQWHPEMMFDQSNDAQLIFEAFVNASKVKQELV
ncbi:gamma-glutamyl-gamma-aminobutyrate hydrolase family protein [Bacillus sp. 03113]|uniref:gamma-glutamyl-gamma-aminobutyrate hydrolase family protein n=1 Tax=Bacillus sp. 03113 TaxID=2578211 RepID=UPI0011417312|nr:gamma-glutamyl-gamma-aminobutyrate hydrolase family protein [Bacillus sp. 03113]